MSGRARVGRGWSLYADFSERPPNLHVGWKYATRRRHVRYHIEEPSMAANFALLTDAKTRQPVLINANRVRYCRDVAVKSGGGRKVRVFFDQRDYLKRGRHTPVRFGGAGQVGLERLPRFMRKFPEPKPERRPAPVDDSASARAGSLARRPRHERCSQKLAPTPGPTCEILGR
jgi:hypothetical protein